MDMAYLRRVTSSDVKLPNCWRDAPQPVLSEEALAVEMSALFHSMTERVQFLYLRHCNEECFEHRCAAHRPTYLKDCLGLRSASRKSSKQSSGVGTLLLMLCHC